MSNVRYEYGATLERDANTIITDAHPKIIGPFSLQLYYLAVLQRVIE